MPLEICNRLRPWSLSLFIIPHVLLNRPLRAWDESRVTNIGGCWHKILMLTWITHFVVLSPDIRGWLSLVNTQIMFWLCLSEFGVGWADIALEGSQRGSKTLYRTQFYSEAKLTDAEVLWSIVFVTLDVFEGGLLLSLLTPAPVPELLTMGTSATLQILISSLPH